MQSPVILADQDPYGTNGSATQRALRLLASACDGRAALLLSDQDGSTLKIEDIFPAAHLIGEKVRVPDGLIEKYPVQLQTHAMRIPLLWTEVCAARPDWLVSAPVPGRHLHVVVAGVGYPPADSELVSLTAELVGWLIAGGEVTARERGETLRVTALIEHLPVPVVFVDENAIDVLLNDRARLLLGLCTDETGGARIAEALAELVGGDDDEVRRRALAADPKVSLMFEIATKGTSGERRYQVATRWIEQGNLLGRIWLFRDVTAEKAFQSQLTELTALLELTVENVDEGVMLVDENRRIVLWNQACVDLFQLPPQLADRGADFMDIVKLLADRGQLGPGSLEAIVAESERRIAVYGYRERTITRGDGHIVDLRYTPISGGHYLLTARDVTDERTAARFKDELIATVSHELRTPLTAITGSLGLLEAGIAGELPEQAAALIDVAHRNATRLGLLVNDLLDMDKLSSGKLEFHFAETDLAPLLSEVMEQNIPYALNFGVGFKLTVPETKVIAEVDPDRIAQVITNLLSNAAKFSPPGSDVRLELSSEPERVKISVIDRGCGMSPEFRRRLFTRFMQEDRSIERGQTGTGLGLAISKSIVDYHGGAIKVESLLGEGSRFDVTLPKRRPTG